MKYDLPPCLDGRIGCATYTGWLRRKAQCHGSTAKGGRILGRYTWDQMPAGQSTVTR